jgi:AraC family transcriptional regulator|uniref:helix-turn-helix domain-containing protein n=1 Tax=Cephaloticoccus sp. TaxID=1985742 RepID=UPI00404B2441
MDAANWQMPLKNPPELVQAGRAVHGRRLKEEVFHLPELWCLHLYNYHGQLSIDGREFEIRPGRVSVTPPNARIVYQFKGESWHAFAHFRLLARGDMVPMPVIQDLGDDYDPLAKAMDEAAGWLPSMPCRASVRLWELLWQLVNHPFSEKAPRKPLHPALSMAVREVEIHLAETLSIPAIARHADISHNHLTRLFKAEFGVTAEGYIRQRRTERALHLLVHTTMAIKTIAAEVGLPDLHFFNKTIRTATGHSPREYRTNYTTVLRP